MTEVKVAEENVSRPFPFAPYHHQYALHDLIMIIWIDLAQGDSRPANLLDNTQNLHLAKNLRPEIAPIESVHEICDMEKGV